MSAKLVELEGGPAFAVVPLAEWRALLDRLESLQDSVDFKEAVARAEETLPLEFAQRRLAGETPLALWRQHRALTLQALAERAGCTRQMLSMVDVVAPYLAASAAIHSSVSSRSSIIGSAPWSSTALWKRRMSNFAPSRALARSRSSSKVSLPIM